jgi:hypothetical protein
MGEKGSSFQNHKNLAKNIFVYLKDMVWERFSGEGKNLLSSQIGGLLSISESLAILKSPVTVNLTPSFFRF